MRKSILLLFFTFAVLAGVNTLAASVSASSSGAGAEADLEQMPSVQKTRDMSNWKPPSAVPKSADRPSSSGGSTQRKTTTQSKPAATQQTAPGPVMPVHDISSRSLIETNFTRYYQRGVQEKLYIRTDKPYYISGEKIWFRGFLVNAITMKEYPGSNFIYVELINSKKEIVKSHKIKSDSTGVFASNFELEAEFPVGDYTLRAYTQWMRNESDELFFHRVLKVENPLDDRLNILVSYTRKDDGNIGVKATFLNSMGEREKNLRLNYILNTEGKPRNFPARTDDEGVLNFNMQPAADTLRHTLEFVVNSDGMNYKRTFLLPSFGQDFDVQLLPEGGVLVPGYLQHVAFKAVGTNGMPIRATGKLYKNDEVQTEFQTVHQGMGRFAIIPSLDAKYTAEFISPDSVVKRFPIEVSPQGCPLQVGQVSDRICCQILPTPGIFADNLVLLVISRGRLVAAHPFPPHTMQISVPKAMLYPGITKLSLIDKLSNSIISERLVFINEGNPTKVEVRTDKKDYAKREMINVELNMKDKNGKPLAGDLSISVTDAGVVKPDSTVGNIMTYMLLSSELKGYIGNPLSYFSGTPTESGMKLDLLMRTHGWNRFDVEKVLRNQYDPHKHPKEESISVAGRIKGLSGDDAKNTTIVFFNRKTNQVEMFPLESTSKFRMLGIDAMGQQDIMIQALNKKGKSSGIELVVEKPTYPKPTYIVPRYSIEETINAALPAEYVNQAKARYYYEGGVRVIAMGSVTVTAERQSTTTDTDPMMNYMATSTMDQETLSRYEGSQMFDVLRMLPGVKVNTSAMGGVDDEASSRMANAPTGSYIQIRGSYAPAAIIFDGMDTEMEFLEFVSVSEIQQIDVLAGPEAAIFGSKAAGGAIVIKSKTGSGLSATIPSPPSMAILKNIGYREPVAFFQPKYDVPAELNSNKPDMRTTLAWEPGVKIGADGKGSFRFYAADTPTTYDINIEGLTVDGSTVVSHATVSRTVY